MSSPIAFEIVSFALLAEAQLTAGKRKALLLFTDNSNEVTDQAFRFVDKAHIEALSKSPGFKEDSFAYSQTMLFSQEAEKLFYSNLILVNASGAPQYSEEDWLKLGGVCANAAKEFDSLSIIAALPHQDLDEQSLASFLCGFRLGNYRFDKYKKAEREKQKSRRGQTVLLAVQESERALRALDEAQILSESVILARDLVNEPANILGTNELVARIQELASLGIEIEILDKAALEREGLHALLAVAQGSSRPPYLAVMHWNGNSEMKRPLALIGKGVVFDSGGISLKSAAKMEEMKGDMGGAAAVIGAMHALAARKAHINIVGVVGIVENMPSGDAQRPGDIVTTLSGQTVEVVNTDAEGRLVLADALYFTKKIFDPQLMIDFATLTGAIIIALGNHYAGLFSNDGALTTRLAEAGKQTGELLWPMPLAPAYDKIIDSQFADMRNSCGREAGSITAAQFLQRFVDGTPWAHLDIAGTASGAEKNAYNHSWATGFGVRLINRFIADFYENQQ